MQGEGRRGKDGKDPAGEGGKKGATRGGRVRRRLPCPPRRGRPRARAPRPLPPQFPRSRAPGPFISRALSDRSSKPLFFARTDVVSKPSPPQFPRTRVTPSPGTPFLLLSLSPHGSAGASEVPKCAHESLLLTPVLKTQDLHFPEFSGPRPLRPYLSPQNRPSPWVHRAGGTLRTPTFRHARCPLSPKAGDRHLPRRAIPIDCDMASICRLVFRPGSLRGHSSGPALSPRTLTGPTRPGHIHLPPQLVVPSLSQVSLSTPGP